MMQTKVLVVEDNNDLREALADTLGLAGYAVTAVGDGYQALDVLEQQEVAMVISDVQMPKMDGHALLRAIKMRNPQLPVLLMTAFGSIPKAVEAIREGAVDYLVKPFEAEVVVNTVGRYVAQPQENAREFIAVDPRSRDLLALASRLATSDVTVMITGPSGAGKEVLAQHIHSHSSRAKAPFVAINCAAIPENMLEATLFGYEKGAFTGAYKACPGKFEQAQGGTLLLDEISEMDLGLQAKLLRVLQEREVEKLGGGKLIQLDVRVLATSNRDMRAQVTAGRFREDLFYRLNVFPLHLPALWERPLDIIPLAQRMLETGASTAQRPIPRLSPEAQEKLLGHRWPGNVRELDNVMQRAFILQSGDLIRSEDIQFECVEADSEPAPVPVTVTKSAGIPRLGDDVRSHEYQLIVDALKKGNGSRKKAAAALGISCRTLRYKLAKMRESGVMIPGVYGTEYAND